MYFKYIIGIFIIFCSLPGRSVEVVDAPLGIVQSFEKLFGITAGKRRNHTKGFCFKAQLIPGDPLINRYTTSALFIEKSQVIGRLSHKGGNAKAPDDIPAEYGMGLSIITSVGTHKMSMNTLDFFPVATPEAFAELMYAKTQGAEAIKKFKNKNTDLQRYKAHDAKKIKKLMPYEGSVFNSINSFYLVNDKNIKTAIRWAFVPSEQKEIVLTPQHDFFFNNMQTNFKDKGVAWDMIITIANEGDNIDNAAISWSGKHQTILAAHLKVTSISQEEKGQCDEINFDPLTLTAGIEASNDPLLEARRSTYALSFGKRITEKNTTNTNIKR